MRTTSKIGLICGLALLGSASAQAQSCQPLPDACEAATTHSQQMVAELADRVSIANAAGQAYCSMLIGLEVSTVCAEAYRTAGETSCAEVLDGQASGIRTMLPQMESGLDPATLDRLRSDCALE